MWMALVISVNHENNQLDSRRKKKKFQYELKPILCWNGFFNEALLLCCLVQSNWVTFRFGTSAVVNPYRHYSVRTVVSLFPSWNQLWSATRLNIFCLLSRLVCSVHIHELSATVYAAIFLFGHQIAPDLLDCLYFHTNSTVQLQTIQERAAFSLLKYNTMRLGFYWTFSDSEVDLISVLREKHIWFVSDMIGMYLISHLLFSRYPAVICYSFRWRIYVGDARILYISTLWLVIR